uniref:Uncharacterized protein n=2 Tax=Melopsittacus undulatus TaxID=13146 RepID=A0A8V5GX01_MELUD
MLTPQILTPQKSEVKSSGKLKCPQLRHPPGFPDMEHSMDGRDVFNPQGDRSCLRDVAENGDGLIQFMASVPAEECSSREVGSCPANVSTSHPDNCCCHREDCVADAQVRDNPAAALPTDTLIHEQADAADHRSCVRDGSDNPAPAGGGYPEQVPSVGDDLDDDLEYFECSDVLTVHEDEIWKKKLQFLLEGDDEDELKLSRDCDACAYFLPHMPCPIPVSDDTAPMETTIGFCGHHSKPKAVNVRRDPSASSQSTLQPEMTLTVGHHRDSSSSLQDKGTSEVPEASAAIGNEHPRAEDNGSNHPAAGFPMDTSKHRDKGPATDCAALMEQAPDTMAASRDKDSLGAGSLLLEEEAEETPRAAVCTLTESLRRNLFRLLSPTGLCRYVSAIGQTLQAAAEPREAGAVGQEGVTAAGSPQMCAAEEGERKRTWGLSEHSQEPAEADPPRNEGADVQISAQSCERLCMEPQLEEEGVSGTCVSAGAIQPAPQVLCTEGTSQAESDNVQTDSQHPAQSEKGGMHQQGMGVGTGAVSPFPVQAMGCAPDKQECLCAVLSSAKLCDEPQQGRQQCSFDSNGSNDTDTFCSLSSDEPVLEAQTKSGLEGGEPVCRGDADVSAVHEKLWQLLHEDEESDCQIPCEPRGITSLEIRLTGTQAPELHCAQETSSDPPLPEQEPVTQPDSRQRTEEGDCADSSILFKGDGASIGNTCLAEAVGADGVCLDSSTGNKPEQPSSICVTANRTIFSTGECLEQEPDPMLADSSGSMQMAVGGEGELLINPASQAWDTGSPGTLKDAQSGDCDKETPGMSHGTVGQLLPTEHNTPLMDEGVTGERCSSRDCYPAGAELPDPPEDKPFFPSGDPNQQPHEELSSVNTLPETYGVSSPEEGDPSALHAQSSPDPDCDLPSRDDCNDSQVVSNAQENVAVIETPESITRKNPSQTTDQVPGAETQAVAFTPLSGEVLLRDLNVEAGGEQREIGRAGAPCASGSQAASEHLGFANSPFKPDGELKAEPIKWKPNPAKSCHGAAGAKKKLPAASLSKKPRLEQREACSDAVLATEPVGSEAGVRQREDRNQHRKLTVNKESKAPRLLKGIQAELFPDCSGNIKLCCQFGAIHSDSTITWTKDS